MSKSGGLFGMFGKKEQPAPNVAEEPSRTKALGAKPAQRVESQAFSVTFDTPTLAAFKLSSGAAATPAGALGDYQIVRLTGGVSPASSGEIGGFSTRVPDVLEAAASGNAVEVTAIARSAGGKLKFGVAYSTNEVGNSGWKMCEAGPDLQRFTFRYDVPPMVNGNGDFVGVWPDMEAVGGTLEFASLSVRVVERG